MIEPLFTDIIRFKIVVLLFRNDLDFSSLKNEISTSDWNINFHLKKLEKSWIIFMSKVLNWNKISTIVSLTEDWRKKLFSHINELENIVRDIK